MVANPYYAPPVKTVGGRLSQEHFNASLPNNAKQSKSAKNKRAKRAQASYRWMSARVQIAVAF